VLCIVIEEPDAADRVLAAKSMWPEGRLGVFPDLLDLLKTVPQMYRAAPTRAELKPGVNTRGDLDLEPCVAKQLVEPHGRAAKLVDLPGCNTVIVRGRLSGQFELLEIEYLCPVPQIVPDAPNDREKRLLLALLDVPETVVIGELAFLYAMGGLLGAGATPRKRVSSVFVHDRLLVDGCGPLSTPGTAHASGSLAGPSELCWVKVA